MLTFAESTKIEMCEETYPGQCAFSEIETRNMRDYLLKMNPVPIFAIALHSYSQYWMYPYAYTKDLPSNVDEMVRF